MQGISSFKNNLEDTYAKWEKVSSHALGRRNQDASKTGSSRNLASKADVLLENGICKMSESPFKWKGTRGQSGALRAAVFDPLSSLCLVLAPKGRFNQNSVIFWHEPSPCDSVEIWFCHHLIQKHAMWLDVLRTTFVSPGTSRQRVSCLEYFAHQFWQIVKCKHWCVSSRQ